MSLHSQQVSASTELVDWVLHAAGQLREETVNCVSGIKKIPSISCKYPGRTYDSVVGYEGTVSQYLADWYTDAGAGVETWEVEPKQTNAIGTPRGSGGRRSLILNGHVDVVLQVTSRNGPQATRTPATSAMAWSGDAGPVT